ncbi:MAG: hypothetical protein KY453_09790 [Gemmatimonadetes bacterium]|nr:hypothetical protein [Gemmatimonadota bacterium]
MSEPAPLRLRDYTLTYRATGLRALNRRELRERVVSAPDDSLFLHFWGRLLRPGWSPGEYGNDLANWAAEDLHDLVLAERLALVDPRRHATIEDLRNRVLQILEERLEEPGVPATEAQEGHGFHFLMAHVVIYDTDELLGHPEELPRRLPGLPTTSLLHHFVDAPGSPVHAGAEMQGWLRGWGRAGQELAERLETVDLFLHDEAGLRQRLVAMTEATLGNGGTT